MQHSRRSHEWHSDRPVVSRFHLSVESLWLGLASAVPLVVNPWGLSLTELPKALALQGSALVMFALAVGTNWNRDELVGTRAFPIPVVLSAALGLTILAASLRSLDVSAGVWGSHAHQQGLLTWAAYLVVFCVLATRLVGPVHARRLFQVVALTSIPITLWGFAQALGWDPSGWQTDAASPVMSTLGRANHLGSWLVMALPITLALASSPRRPRRWWLLVVGAQAACLVLTQARGALLGASVALAVFAFGYAWLQSSPRVAVGAAALLVVLTLSGMLLIVYPAAPSNLTTQSPVMHRLAQLGDFEGGATAARLTVWKATAGLIASQPLLGYGPETMHLAFAPVFPPELVYYEGRKLTWDRAHNLVADTALSFGLIGVGLLAALLATVLVRARSGLQQLRRTLSPRGGELERGASSSLLLGATSAVIGHLVDTQFTFESISSATLFWLSLGACWGLSRSEPLAAASEPTLRTGLGPRCLGVLGVALAIVLLGSGLALLADVSAQQASSTGISSVERIGAGLRAVSLRPYVPLYHQQLARAYVEAGDLALAAAAARAGAEASRRDPAGWALVGVTELGWAQQDGARFATALAAYQRAVDLCPNCAPYHADLGVTLLRMGRVIEAVSALERAIALDATFGEGFTYLSEAYQVAGRNNDARQARAIARVLLGQDRP